MVAGKRIIVGLDGSAFGEAALPYVEVFAKAKHATVVLIRVVHPNDGSIADHHYSTSESESPDLSSAEGDQAPSQPRDEAERYLGGIAERLRERGVNVETIVVAGEPARVLIEEAEPQHADLIILSTHGRSGLGRWIYGSVADQVMRTATVPVLLIPSGCHFRWPDQRAPRILVPLDGSPLAEGALKPAVALADSLAASLILVRVIGLRVVTHSWSYPDGTAYLAESLDLEEAEARQYLDRIAARLRGEGREVKEIAQIGVPAFTIIDIAREEQADLIALSTHGAGGLTRLVMGSVATTLVRHASQPVLVIHPRVGGVTEPVATAIEGSAPPASA